MFENRKNIDILGDIRKFEIPRSQTLNISQNSFNYVAKILRNFFKNSKIDRKKNPRKSEIKIPKKPKGKNQRLYNN